jgi:hypothetical protein
MAALVQSYPQQSSTLTMLQASPSTASSILQTPSQAPSHHQYPTNPVARNSFHGMNNGMGISNYRGQTAVAPIAPYAFTSTPSLATPGQRMQNGPHARSDQRVSSAPVVSASLTEAGTSTSRSRYPAPASVSTTSSSSSSDLSSLGQKSGSRDDSAIPGTTRVPSGNPRPHSTIITSATTLNFVPAISSSVKASPDRYRRPNNRRVESSTNGQQGNHQPAAAASAMPNVMQFYGSTKQTIPSLNSYQGLNLQMPQLFSPAGHSTPVLGVALDDMQLNRHKAQDQAQRYRRRSIHTIDAGDFMTGGGNSISTAFLMQGSRQVSSANGRIDHQQPQHPLRSSPVVTPRPNSHVRDGSTGSVNSTRSNSRPNSVSDTIYPSPSNLLPVRFVELM